MVKQCQSCGMPLVSKKQGDMRGSKRNGSPSEKWCKLCYEKGSFTGPDCTLNQMLEIVENAMQQQGINSLMRWMARKQIPRLERWR